MKKVAVLLFVCAAFAAEEPETVMVTYHVKGGSEAEMERVIARHWTTASTLKLIRDTPHVTLRGTEGGGETYFVDVFTWRDASIPDKAPPEIQKIWGEMNGLTQERAGHPGIEFAPVTVVTR